MPADDLERLVEEHIQEAEMTCTTATLKAIDGRKKELALIRGVQRNAIDQMVAGNTKDPWAEPRMWIRDVAQAGGNPEAYIEDIRMIILNNTKIVSPTNIASDFMKKNLWQRFNRSSMHRRNSWRVVQMLSDCERDCRSKKTYFTRADAKRYRKKCQTKYGKPFKVYKCSCCPFYHLTTNRNYTVLEEQ